MTTTPPAILDDAVPPTDTAPANLPAGAAVPSRGVALGFALISIAAMSFTTWWANKLATTHILSFHGCACARLSRENFVMFGALPALSLLIFHGARQAVATYVLAIAGVGVAAGFAAFGYLAAIYFGFLYAHGA